MQQSYTKSGPDQAIYKGLDAASDWLQLLT